MKHLLLTLTLLFTCGLFAQQTEDVTYEYRKGKKYIVHFVQNGNTLWGIHSAYNVPVDDIVAANPGIEKGLNDGQKILVPVGAADAKYPDGTLIKEHVVQKSEGLYGIAKREGTTVDELTKLNPGTENGLKLGQVIKIPVTNNAATTTVKETPPAKQPNTTPSVSFYDTIVNHTVLAHETLYSISKRFMVPVKELQAFNKMRSEKVRAGDVIQIPLKKEKIKQVPIRQVTEITPDRKLDEDLLFTRKNEYHIAVLLPFYLDGGEGSSAGLKGIATEFYMGVELAVDSLEKLGLRAKVHVYDAQNDSLALMQLLKKPEMKKMDLIIGPLIPQGADIVGRWCRQNSIRMVCPSACNSALLKENPYIYAAVPSDITQQRILARYTIENHNRDQIVLVNTGVAKDKDLYEAYRARFMELSKAAGNIKLIEVKTEEIGAFIRRNGNTVFVVPTRDKGAAIKFMNALHKADSKAGNGTISVFGTKDWGNFDDIAAHTKNKYNLHWVSSSDLNYTLGPTKNLLLHYRQKYKSDMSRYGAHGFDVMFYFTRSLLMEKSPGQGVISSFAMEQVGPGNGFENSQCFVLKHVEYELVRVAVAHE